MQLLQWAKQSFRIGLAAGAFAYFFIGGAVLSWIVLPLCQLSRGTECEKRERCQKIVQHAFVIFHAYLRKTGLLNFNPAEYRAGFPDRPAVIVANHPTLVDTTALIATYDRLCVVTKSSLHRNLLIGPLLRYCGHLRSGEIAFESVFEMIETSKNRLAEGCSILIFPERTRSPYRQLHRFRRGAFELAEQAGVPVLPVFIWAEPPGLKRGQPWWDIPRKTIQFKLMVGTLILPLDSTKNPYNSRKLRDMARTYIQAQHACHTEQLNTDSQTNPDTL